jgi:pimeloyl-ACP methyl ester carboxylesterase
METSALMNIVRLDGAREQLLGVPGGRIHAVELGEGPLVFLIHGFPEGWWSVAYQLPGLAAAGFRAMAIHVRGYGASSHPADMEAYRMLAHVADTAAVVREPGSNTTGDACR